MALSWQIGKANIHFPFKKICFAAIVRLLGVVRLAARGLAFVISKILYPIFKEIDKGVFYYLLFPIYKFLRGAFHTAETASLSARRKILFMLAGRQAIPFFLVVTSLLVATSNIYAQTAASEAGPGERSLMFSFFATENEELMYDWGEAQDPLFSEGSNGAAVFGGNTDQIPDSEDEVLPLIVGEGAIAQPIITSAAPSAAPRTKIEIYVVKAGDTPDGIAKRFGLNSTSLFWANGLTSRSVIRIGQELKIPPTDGLIYTIKRGDTIAGIAKTYRSDGASILSYNRLSPQDKLAAGTVIIIPNGRPPAPPPPPVRPKTVIVPKVPSADTLPGGRFLWPVIPTSSNNGRYITQYFKWNHTGVDIDGDFSNPVIASDGGVVKLVHYGKTAYGYQVVIDHENGILTRYAHLSKILVEQGQRVDRGQTVGILGTTGRSTGTHLHYEVFVNGKRVNPLTYIR